MKYYSRLLSLTICLFSISVNAQTFDKSYIDSLYQTKKDQTKIERDKDIDRLYSMSFRVPNEKVIALYEYLDSLSIKSDYIQINFLDDYSSALHRHGKLFRSRDKLLYGFELAKKYDRQDFEFKFSQLLSYHYIDRGITDSALYYIQNAEKTIESSPGTMYKSWPIVYERRSEIEALLGNLDKSDAYLDEIVKFIDTIENFPNKAYLLSKVTYHYKVTKNYKKHAYHGSKLKEYYLKKNDFKLPEFHSSIASILVFEETDKHIAELKRILEDPNLSKDSSTYNAVVNSLAEAFIATENYSEVAKYLLKYRDPEFTDANLTNRILNLINLEEAYLRLKDYKNAYETIRFRKVLQDSIRRMEMIDKVADYEVKYETEQKDAALKLVSVENEKNKQQKQLFSIIAIGGILASIIIAFLFFKNRKKKTQLEQQKALLEKTVDEKNVLLKETHHRVKNSFQIVSSLLFLQSKNIQDKEAQLAIKEAQNRVRSMVLIHQKLYSKDELVGIETKEYFSDLVRDIFESHQDKSQGLQYQLNVDSMVLNIETITPIGLILNELIVNVLKHAFSEITKDSLMEIEFSKQNDHLKLKVKDNGEGINGDVKESSFGIKLIKSLVKKLKGTVNFESEQLSGTEVDILIHKFEML